MNNEIHDGNYYKQMNCWTIMKCMMVNYYKQMNFWIGVKMYDQKLHVLHKDELWDNKGEQRYGL